MPLAIEPQRVQELMKAIFRRVKQFFSSSPLPVSTRGLTKQETSYQRWIRKCDTLTDADREAVLRHIRSFKSRPLISVVMPVFETPEKFLREAIESVQRQIYPHWELCIADDASQATHVAEVLSSYVKTDSRIKSVHRDTTGHIVAATNSALEIAAGDFVAFMDHDDLLAEHALYEIVHEINLYPDVDVVYSDEDHIDENGHRSTPHFKTDWNRELMLGYNLLNHLCLFRRRLIEQVGRLREGFEGAQDYDLALRIIDASAPERVRHVAAVLYHWRQTGATFSKTAAERCASAARRAVEQHLQRRGEDASIEPHPIDLTWQRVRRKLSNAAPLVSLIVPTKDKADTLKICADGLLHRTTYTNLELIIVDHESCELDTSRLFAELAKDPRVRVLSYIGAFNYSAINNFAVAHANGEIIGLINNDIDVISPDWLNEMVAHAVRPEVGAVGARLLFADGRVQHAGMMVGVGDIAGHFCKYIARDDPGYFGRALITSEVTAVTGACLVVRKTVYDQIGGLDEVHLPDAFNDVDFCLKLRAKGYINIFTPDAELYHLESASRAVDTRPERAALFESQMSHMRTVWKSEIKSDPYYNVNISPQSENFDLALARCRLPPWRKNANHSIGCHVGKSVD